MRKYSSIITLLSSILFTSSSLASNDFDFDFFDQNFGFDFEFDPNTKQPSTVPVNQPLTNAPVPHPVPMSPYLFNQQPPRQIFSSGKPWTDKEEQLLILWKTLGLSWKKIEQFFPGRSQSACQNRYNAYLKNKEVDLAFAAKHFAKLPSKRQTELWSILPLKRQIQLWPFLPSERQAELFV
ncbi:MAG: SANT/Myb domain-containing protein, partial [Puniceicoccales bacterium]|nr:SANT/Myb domain-containing protein [Puniceicoccales bacterium]